jgi:hypothetical protein
MVSKQLQKQASQLSPNSVTNQENSSSEQYVSKKLQHTGENFAPAGQTSYGLQQTRDLANQGPNTGPLADTISDLPQNRDPLHDIPDNPLMTVLESAGEPEQGTKEPEVQGDAASEKLQLKKDASVLLQRFDETAKLGQQLVDHMMSLIATQKTASISNKPVYTPESVLEETKAQAAEQEIESLKTATVEMVENTIYAAGAVALAIKEKMDAAKQTKQASGELPPEEGGVAPQAEVGGDAALAAMQQPTGMEPGGSEDISEAEAQALMQQSLAENGAVPEDVAPPEGDLLAAEGGDLGGDLGGGDLGGESISPEEMALFQQAMQQAGIGPEEMAQAIAEIQAEQGAGITQEEANLGDDEAAKTGHYKFASVVQRQPKAPDQEKRAACVRGVIREFCRGLDITNFN